MAPGDLLSDGGRCVGSISHLHFAPSSHQSGGASSEWLLGLTINAASTDLQLPVTPNAYELGSWDQTVAAAFTWVTVS